MRSALIAAMLCLLVAPAWAQAPPPTLPPVIVETPRLVPERRQTEEQARDELERVPGSVDIIPQRDIEQSRAANLKDVLDFTPGVIIRPRFGAADESQLSIRGSGLRDNFHLRGVNVLLDGFIYGQADGFSDFESLELLTTKRVDIPIGRAQSELCGETQLTSTWHHQKLARPGRPSAARCFGLCQRNRLFLSHKG